MSKKDRPITQKELTDAVRELLLAPRGEARSENREPTREELNRRYKVGRKRRKKN